MGIGRRAPGCQAFVLEHDSCRSSVTERQMKTVTASCRDYPACYPIGIKVAWQASLTASQAREDSQTTCFEDTIEFSILTDLIPRKITEEE